MNLPYEERYKDISEVCAVRGRYLIKIPQIELLGEIIPARTVIYLHGNESGAIGDSNLPWPPYFHCADNFSRWMEEANKFSKRPDLIIYDDYANDPSPDFGG